jgi:predicted RNA-binding Zn-ribbon protein involved in translation (DUF1610 family)
MSENGEYTERCPICDDRLDRNKQVGYYCPNCGWDESVELEDDEVWVAPDERGD